jgi:sulfur transfer complex TusBCD TusB component (DsrH family)
LRGWRANNGDSAMWKRYLSLALIAFVVPAGAASALELSMICENPRRIYVAHVDREARSFRVEATDEITTYQVREVVNLDVGFIMRGSTVDDGPDFAAYVSGDPRIEFLVDGEIVQTDDCLSTGSPEVPDEFVREAMHVPASVEDVASGGYWTQGGVEGFFRIVVLAYGVEHVVHRLYVQLVAVSSEDQSYRLVSSVSVKEINEGHGVTLELTPYFVAGRTAEIVAFPRGGGHGQPYLLIVRDDGGYELLP